MAGDANPSSLPCRRRLPVPLDGRQWSAPSRTWGSPPWPRHAGNVALAGPLTAGEDMHNASLTTSGDDARAAALTKGDGSRCGWWCCCFDGARNENRRLPEGVGSAVAFLGGRRRGASSCAARGTEGGRRFASYCDAGSDSAATEGQRECMGRSPLPLQPVTGRPN